jgi:hypothetical protein
VFSLLNDASIDRPAFKLEGAMKAYNLFVTLLSLWIFLEVRAQLI